MTTYLAENPVITWYDSGPYHSGKTTKLKDSTTCKVCHQDKGKGCWVWKYGERVFICPDCYKELEKAKQHPYSALAERLALAIAGWHANRKYARA